MRPQERLVRATAYFDRLSREERVHDTRAEEPSADLRPSSRGATSVASKAKRVGWAFALAPLAFALLFTCKFDLSEFPLGQTMRNSDEAWEHWGYGFYAAIRNMYPGRALVVEVPDRVSVKHLSRLTGLSATVDTTGAERHIDYETLRAHPRFDIAYNPVAYVPYELASEETGQVATALLFFPSAQTSRVHIVAAGDEILVVPAELMARSR